MRNKVVAFTLCVFLILTFASLSISLPALAENSVPTFSRFGVTPRKGQPDIEYLFTATYRDSDNDAPVSVKVFIDQVGYEMEELDPTDVNYTDSKDYFFRIILSQGTYTFYFTCDDGNGNECTTPSYTLDVTWNVGHYDLIHYFEDEVYPGILLIMAVFVAIIFILCIIMIVMVFQMRKIGKVLKERGERVDAKLDEEETNLTQ
jgi:hypothetical protein